MLHKDSYFEFSRLRQNITESPDEADIFMISCGPIVGKEGLTPGIDINLFVRRHLIETDRTKPATLIIDLTSALYKNIHLDEDVARLVQEGKLSIIAVESHQKFGLLHTDQAQYGRLFGLCAKGSFGEEMLQQIQQNSQTDFNHCVDMRIGAFISSTCGDILEQIKIQHFKNGALLRAALEPTGFLDSGLVTGEDILANKNEDYFLDIQESRQASAKFFWTIENRDSFGHYNTTSSGLLSRMRISAGASDDLDELIEAVKLSLSLLYYKQPMQKLLYDVFKKSTHLEGEALFLENQVILLAIIGACCIHLNIPSSVAIVNENTLASMIVAYHLLKNCIKCCPLLKGRQDFRKIEQKLIQLQGRIAACGINITDSIEATIRQIVPLPTYSDGHGHSLEALIITEMLKKREEVSVPASVVDIVVMAPAISSDTYHVAALPLITVAARAESPDVSTVPLAARPTKQELKAKYDEFSGPSLAIYSIFKEEKTAEQSIEAMRQRAQDKDSGASAKTLRHFGL